MLLHGYEKLRVTRGAAKSKKSIWLAERCWTALAVLTVSKRPSDVKTTKFILMCRLIYAKDKICCFVKARFPLQSHRGETYRILLCSYHLFYVSLRSVEVENWLSAAYLIKKSIIASRASRGNAEP